MTTMDQLKDLKSSVYDLIRMKEQVTINIQQLVLKINEIETKQTKQSEKLDK